MDDRRKSQGRSWPSVATFLLALTLVRCDADGTVETEEGDLSLSGGSPTVRAAYPEQEDDPWTTNDESNDQPVGHYGTLTMSVSNLESGNSYRLDVELEGIEARRIYFPRGGWVDFFTCELEDDLTGSCMDEEGRTWTFYGSSDDTLSDTISEESAEEDTNSEDDPASEEPDEEGADPDGDMMDE